MRRGLPKWMLAVLAGLMGVLPAAGQEEVAVEWRFEAEGEFLGWQVGGHIRDAEVAGGALTGRAVDWDPILIGPVFEIAATPTQRVEIKMKAPGGGSAQLFWTETLEGQHGGFSQAKCDTFSVHDGDRFRVYRIHPFWHAAGKIIRLRLDPPSTGAFAVESIRVVDAGGPASDARAWRFDAGAQGWRAWRDADEPRVHDGGLRVTAQGNAPMLMSPLLSVSADENPYVAIRMAVDAGKSGRVYCVSSKHAGWEDVAFELLADGRMHTYNVDMVHLGRWDDRVLLLGIQPTDAEGASARIESIEIADEPRGPAELAVRYFGRAEGVNRAGRPCPVILSLGNRGGRAAHGVAATLRAPSGVTIVGPARQTVENLTRYVPKSVAWQIESPRPGRVELAVDVSGAGLEPATSTASIEFTPVPEVPPTDYIPEPQPVASKYEVGAFYFPGWPDMSRWRPILDYPLRKPVLGWYDEANPECADWQIKWAVEHGIDFFMVDWYWCKGNRHLEHWLHDAYGKARFRKYLKWAIMWANHNPPDTHSLDDWREVTQYWIDHYFGMEEYYRIDGRPAVFLWSPGNIRRDLGGSAEAARLYALSQKMARDAGLEGIYFVAMSSHDSEDRCKELRAEGYAAFTTYHGFQLAAARAGTRRFPFADVVATGPEVWRAEDERASGLVHMPIVDTGWSSEPWHGSKALVIADRTPELFGELCRKAARYADETGKRFIAIGPWNEWGEGSYIEPYAEYGFRDLEALRAAFCPPGDYPPALIPADVGRGPYDLPRIEPKTAWSFDVEGDFEGWRSNGHMRAEVRGGLLSGVTTGNDPILQGPGIQVEAGAMRTLTIRMRSSESDRAQLFWATAVSAQSEANSVRFDVAGDGQFHDYKLDLGASRRWRGLIVSLRLDPANKAGVEFAVDSIRFE